MNVLSVRKYIFIALIVLVAAQLACNAGSQTPSGMGNPSSSNESQAPQSAPATKGERGTPDEAKAMLQLAIQHYQQVGRDQALKDFNNGVSPFKDRDLYVVCMDPNHIELANGGFPQYVGVSADSLQSNDGQPLGKATWDIASTTTVNSVNYHWVNPVSGVTEPKTLFFLKFDTNVLCGVGAYNP